MIHKISKKKLQYKLLNLYFMFLIIFAYPARMILKFNFIYITDILFIIIFFIFILSYKKNNFYEIKIYNFLMFLYLLICLISLFFGKEFIFIANLKGIRAILLAIISFIIPQFISQIDYTLSKIISFLRLVGLIVIIIEFKQFFLGYNSYEEYWIINQLGRDLMEPASLKVFSTLGSGNTLAYFLVILYSIFLVKNRNVLNNILLFIVGLAIILTKVKMAIVTIFFMSLFHILFFTKLKNKVLNLINFSFIISASYLVFNKIYSYFKDKMDYFTRSVSVLLRGDFTESHSIRLRYNYIIYTIENTNILFGNGLGYISYNEYRPNIIDNHYFRVYAEIGIIGFLFFVLPILIISFSGLRSSLIIKNNNLLILTYSTVGALFLMLTSNLLDNTLVIIMFYFILGSIPCLKMEYLQSQLP